MKKVAGLSEEAERSKKLIAFINEFLEVQIGREELLSAPKKIAHYRRLLKNCLSEKARINHGSELDFGHGDTYEAATGILALHRYMKSFWEIFRQRASIPIPFIVPRKMKRKEEEKRLQKWWEASDEAIFEWKAEGHSWEEAPEWRPLSGLFRAEFLQFYFGRVMEDYVDLLTSKESILLSKCADEKCQRWFLRTAKNKEHCGLKCASRDYQKRLRTEHPEEYKKYHDEWIQKNYNSPKDSKRKEEEDKSA